MLTVNAMINGRKADEFQTEKIKRGQPTGTGLSRISLTLRLRTFNHITLKHTGTEVKENC